MSKPIIDRTVTYTYKDYLTWDGPERWELIDGIPYLLASPTPEHQQIIGELFYRIRGYLDGKPCTPFISPLDLTFERDEATNKVVQPDLFVMCGEYGRDKRIVGVPVLVVEILSPSTASNDFVRKLNLYERFGVQEYWIVAPEERVVNVYLFNGTALRWKAEYKPGDRLSPSMFPDLAIAVDAIFA